MTWDSQLMRNEPHQPGCRCDACRNSEYQRNRVRRNMVVLLLVVAAVIAGCAVLVSHH